MSAETAGYYRRMQAAVEELLVLRGVVTREQIDAQIAAMESRNHERGGVLVARAWVDPAFKARLLADVRSAAAELGIDIGPIPIVAIENTRATHNVIVCTLRSCYPRMLLGVPPHWYKSREYRSRVVREPRAVLAEFGLELPREVAVVVHDSTAELRYLVLPERPEGTEGWGEEDLAALVTRDCLIGTARPRVAA
jgi:nitrile hydratase